MILFPKAFFKVILKFFTTKQLFKKDSLDKFYLPYQLFAQELRKYVTQSTGPGQKLKLNQNELANVVG